MMHGYILFAASFGYFILFTVIKLLNLIGDLHILTLC